MAKIQSWEVSDSFWEKVEPLIPAPERDPQKTYNRVGGGLTASLSHTTGHTVHVPRRFPMLRPFQACAANPALK